MTLGSLALVGSGEYLPSMQPLEAALIQDAVANGKRRLYVQLATAAGREGIDRLAYWRHLGKEQAERLGIEVLFLPVYDREGALNSEYAQQVEGAALTYFSGGDPQHLARSLYQTPLWDAVNANHRSGGSLAGCSAGAMFLASEVPSLRFLHQSPIPGMGLVPNLHVIPHYDVIHKWIPDAAVRLATRIPPGITLTGIDEETALVRRPSEWTAWGQGGVHLLNGKYAGIFRHDERLPQGL